MFAKIKTISPLAIKPIPIEVDSLRLSFLLKLLMINPMKNLLKIATAKIAKKIKILSENKTSKEMLSPIDAKKIGPKKE